MTDLPLVFMYSGQGSQYYQMGKPLFDSNPRFKAWMNYCDDVVRDKIGLSLIHVLYGDQPKSKPFDDVLLSSIALICFEYSITRSLMDYHVKPDVLLGYSLGEVSAAIISGAITLEEGIDVAVGFANTVNSVSESAAMVAVLAPSSVFEEMQEGIDQCWVTGYNFANHFVVTGLSESIDRLKERLDRHKIVNQTLPVNFGFHTPLIDEAKHHLNSVIKNLEPESLSLPIFSSLKCGEISCIDDDFFWQLVRQPVFFEAAVGKILSRGDYAFLDVGPSGTLSTFVKYILPRGSQSMHVEIATQFGKDVENFDKVTAVYDSRQDRRTREHAARLSG